MMTVLYDQFKLTGMESPSVLQQYLCIASNTPSLKTVKFLCTEMIPHSLSVIGQAAVTVTTKLVKGMYCLCQDICYLLNFVVDPSMSISAENAEALLKLINPYKER